MDSQWACPFEGGNLWTYRSETLEESGLIIKIKVRWRALTVVIGVQVIDLKSLDQPESTERTLNLSDFFFPVRLT